MKRIRFMMLGGFLGAGKTTALARLARHWLATGLNVCLVTNDQAQGLVDTESLRAQGFDVGEVTGACFCCKFDDLVATIERLAAERRPDIILAEPVGSCTDLVATVIEPLAALHGDRYEIAPLAVLLKPEHGRKILSNTPGAGFSPKAAYIFLKQLEEADVVALNKTDQLDTPAREELLRQVRERYPEKRVFAVSARRGDGFDELIACMDCAGPVRSRTPDVDYDIYAAGEAELGWLNCRLTVESPEPFGIDGALIDLVDRLGRRCAQASAEPAHLKVLAAGDGATAIGNLVSSDRPAELSLASGATAPRLELTINARVAVSPETLSDIVRLEVEAWSAEWGLTCEISGAQCFRPGRPTPTHRMALGG
jgi:Ni2+-binding GTPase involved in maturation of urease and hydrogenase